MPSFLSSCRLVSVVCTLALTLSSASFSFATEAILPPIATPTLRSSTFQSVPEMICDTTCVNKVYKIYAKNRNLFDQCVVDGDYQIFPHTGKYPNSSQLRALVKSPACIAIFTAVLLADIPACDLGGTPLRSAAETLLTLKVDIVDDGHKPPTSARFKELMVWRYAVGLAQAASVPYDSRSELFAQYTRNLGIALSDSSVQVFMDYTVVFLLPTGTISRGAPVESKGSGSGRSGSSAGVHAYLDEQNDVAVAVTLTVPPSPAPTAQIAFSLNQSSPDTVSNQKASSAVAGSYTQAAWCWSLAIVVVSAGLSL